MAWVFKKVIPGLMVLLGFGVFLLSCPADAQKGNTAAGGGQERQKGTGKGSAATRERGRYLVKIAGCNDCHTHGYIESESAVPEKQWLKGSSLGWRGPWGTTYAWNLRRFLSALPEDQWLNFARATKSRPPMPWWALNEMEKEDLRAIHAFVRHLGPDGEDAPAYLPPDRAPKQPYVQFPSPQK
jgi:mono/diheme cytochrome c family protein